MQGFRNALDECGFLDLGYIGNKFTWYKNYLISYYIGCVS